MVKAGTLREDLYYRLNVVSIVLPPLRARREDISLLVRHFLRKYELETGRMAPAVSQAAGQLLGAYSWPGNVRELENVVERAVLLSTHGVITPDTLPARLNGPQPEAAPPGTGTDLRPLDSVIEDYIGRVLEHTSGNRTRAAQILGISRRTLHRMDERRRRSETTDSDT
jgi:transcriptional regulator with PAS, ATPase and Fis domain